MTIHAKPVILLWHYSNWQQPTAYSTAFYGYQNRPWQTCDRLAADLRPGCDRPLFPRVMATAIRPTHELKDRLVAYLRPYPELGEGCRFVNLKPDWDLWKRTVLLPFMLKRFCLRDQDRLWRGLLSQCTTVRANRKSNSEAVRPRLYLHNPECIVTTSTHSSVLITIITWHFQFHRSNVNIIYLKYTYGTDYESHFTHCYFCYVTWWPLTAGIVPSRHAAHVMRKLTPLISACLNW